MNLGIAARKVVALVALGVVSAVYTNADDWMTAGNDAQRSSWVRTDPKISVDAFRKPSFGLVWKLKPENTQRQLNSLMPGVLLDFYIGYRGFRALGFFAGSSNRLIAIDTELGRLEWQKDFSGGGSAQQSTETCPGGITVGATRPTTTAYPSGLGGRRAGRGTPAKSAVGLPDQGAVTLHRAPPRQRAPAPVRRPAGAAAAANPFAPRIQWLMALGGDGYLHSMWVSNGHEPKPPVRFLPGGADARGLIVFDQTAYVATTHNCGGVEDGVWALNLETEQVKHWKPESGTIAGSAGAAVGPDGTLYAATTAGELVALAPKTLARKAAQKVEGVKFTSSPVVFDLNNKNLIAVAASDGRLYLFDAALAGSPIARSAVYSDPDFDAGSLTTWRDEEGMRWLIAPAGGNAAQALAGSNRGRHIEHGAVVAWKLAANGNTIEFQPGWVSPDLISPITPVVENGVVFALSSGEFRSSKSGVPVLERVKQSSPAVLYALNGRTGEELWNSGHTISSFVHSGTLVGGETRLYLADYEGNQYAFGIPIEH